MPKSSTKTKPNKQSKPSGSPLGFYYACLYTDAMYIDNELVEYVEKNVFPQYEGVDPAHDLRHIQTVIDNSLRIAATLDVDMNMVFAIAAYHDVGIRHGRENHEITSAKYLEEDKNLLRFFDEVQIHTMKEAVEDHRASSKHEPRSIYGRIIAEADRDIEPRRIISRSVEFALAHHPGASQEELVSIVMGHLNEKYGRNGYLKLFLHDPRNEEGLESLRKSMEDAGAETLVRELLKNR